MIILTLRTDKPDAEIGLYDNCEQLGYEVWEAHRALAETLHGKIKVLLYAHKLVWKDIAGIVVYAGPGSFTGLRIGISAANALAYANNALITGTAGDDWLKTGLKQIQAGTAPKRFIIPEYGSEAHITIPKK